MKRASDVTGDRILVEKIIASLDVNPAAVERAMVLLYGAQTDSEKSSGTTTESNNVGFAANDAASGTRIVKNVILRATVAGLPAGRRLWGSSLKIGRRIAKRYAGTQLLVIAKKKRVAEVAEIGEWIESRQVAELAELAERIAILEDEQSGRWAAA